MEGGAAKPAHPVTHTAILEASGSGRIEYLGFDVDPAAPRPGQALELKHYFRVSAPFAGEHAILVHGTLPDGGRVFTADHHPLAGRVPLNAWRSGDVWVDTHRVVVPVDIAGARIDLYVGLGSGERRLTVEASPGAQDGRDRIRAGSIALTGVTAKDDLPEVTIPRTSTVIAVDGRLDESAWERAPVLTFADSMGRDVPTRFPTKLKLLYDDTHLYVAFESIDIDITCPFEQRDDPIYDHEAVEIFIMPRTAAPSEGPYVELQASPKGVIFDAAFLARRTGMDTRFDAGQKVATSVDGTLNVDDGTDRRWISEWAVPWTGIRGVSTPPQRGDEWRMNAFRIEKFRTEGQPGAEYTAWSPPRVGDFHNVARFGRMKFGD